MAASVPTSTIERVSVGGMLWRSNTSRRMTCHSKRPSATTVSQCSQRRWSLDSKAAPHEGQPSVITAAGGRVTASGLRAKVQRSTR